MSLSPSLLTMASSPGNLRFTGDPQCPIATILEELDGSSGDHSHLLCPRGHNSFHRCLEVRSIARDESQSMDSRGGGDECVPWLHRAAHGLASGHKPAARIRCLKINRQDPFPKAQFEVLSQPSV